LRIKVIAILSIGQIVGWGTTFYVPAVMADPMARELGVARETLFLGVSLMVAIGALLSPPCGRLMDRYGAGTFLPLGTLLIGVGLLQLAALATPHSAILAWVLFGMAMPMALSLAGPTLLAQVSGARAKSDIAVMMLFTGLSSSIFWPIAGALNEALAWRGALAVFAALNLLLVLPVQLTLAGNRNRRVSPREGEGGAAPPPPPPLAPRLRRRAQWLMVTAFCLQGLGSWGIPLQMIALFEHLGVAGAAAVGIAALNGPATIAARLAEVTLGARLQPMTTAVIAAAHIPLSFLALLVPVDPAIAACLFTAIFFGASGVMSVLRATLPLTLLGSERYGALLGRLALPQNLAFAAAPFLFAVVFKAAGPVGGTLFALGLALAALAAVIGLALTVHRARPARP
jgi:predicted MFS family arabinose efflux permease